MSSSGFLGKGFSFPVTLDSSTGKINMTSDEEDIKQAIYIILMTKKYERAMLPDFGCNIHNYVFDLPDETFKNLLQNEIIDALIMWENRITDVNVNISVDDINNGKVIVDISYIVRSTNNPNNLVFPYYMTEGEGDR